MTTDVISEKEIGKDGYEWIFVMANEILKEMSKILHSSLEFSFWFGNFKMFYSCVQQKTSDTTKKEYEKNF